MSVRFGSWRGRLRCLRIESMKATRPEDVADILEGIPDKAAFNTKLQSQLFHTLLSQWRNLDAHEQMGVIGRIARWQGLVNTRRSIGVCQYRQDADPHA